MQVPDQSLDWVAKRAHIRCLLSRGTNLKSMRICHGAFQFNMLDRISTEQQQQICKWLDGLVKKYHSTSSISAIFPQL